MRVFIEPIPASQAPLYFGVQGGDKSRSTLRLSKRAPITVLGHQVATVSNGKEAVDYHRQHGRETDLVVLDSAMPAMNGPDCFRALKELDLLPDTSLTECALNATVGKIIRGTIPARGFGAHDCRSGCPAHLWRAARRVSVRGLALRLGGEVVLPKR